jgi:methyl-accepting chemotaxis protein
MNNWKAYDEVHFSDKYILRWIREGNEYVNRITCDMMDDLQSVVKQQAAQLEESRAANHRFTELITQQREHTEELRQEIYKLKGQR